MHFVAALDQVPEMRGVLCLFEGVCSGAADGYARMLRRPACTLLHLGPGLANGLANFHNARKACSPVVSIVGEHSLQHLEHDAPLTADVAAFARTVGEVFYARRASDIATLAPEAVRAAVRPPGGVASLIIPADLSWSEAGEPMPPPELPRPATLSRRDWEFVPGPATGILLSGSTLMGPGLDAAGRIAAKSGVRVFANRNTGRTQSGRGRFQPTRVPYFPEPAEAALSGLERLILVEAKPPVSFFGYPGKRSTLAPPECRILTLASPEEDGTAALVELADELGARNSASIQQQSIELPNRQLSLTPALVGQTIAALLPEQAIVSDEAISAGEPLWAALLQAAPHDHLPVTGGSIGQGLPVAVGAAVACPDRKVVCLEADGSAMYTLQSLWTMARERLNVVTVIYNNRRYRILDVEMERTGVQSFGAAAERMIGIGAPDLNFVQIANSMGVEASRATTVQALADQFQSACQTSEPRLIEAVLP